MPHEAISRLKPGTTTMAQARAALGAPEKSDELPDGGQVWVYRFAPDPVPAPPDLPVPTDAHRTTEVLRLVFGPTGILKSSEATRSMLQVSDTALPSEHEALRDIRLPGE